MSSEIAATPNVMFSAHALLICLFSLSGKARCSMYGGKNGTNLTVLFITFETLRHFIKQKSVKCLYFTFEYEQKKIESSLQQVGNHANIFLGHT